MIETRPPNDVRGFFHKKLIGAAVKFGTDLIPGAGTALQALQVGRSLVSGGNGGPKKAGRLGKTARKACRARGGSIVRTPGRPTRCSVNGAPPAVRTPGIPSSIPVPVPVREVVLEAKPVEPIKEAKLPRTRIPTVVPPAMGGDVSFGPRDRIRIPQVFDRGPRTRTPIRRPTMPRHHKPAPVFLSGGGGGGCLIPGQRRDPNTGECAFFLGQQIGQDDAPIGQAVMGQFGAAYVPGSMIVDRAVCLPGDVVGRDGLCYPKKSIRNSDREWPRGRRPLLTGGDMRAISIAARAAGRLTRTAGRLQDMGLIKKPIVRKQIKKKN